MKDQIHTIPVLDALRQPETCPFCVMRRRLEQNAVEFIMGTAYMEGDIRMETNRRGFCAAHLEKMYAQQNRLGLALMLHTFLQRWNKEASPGFLQRLRTEDASQGRGKSILRLKKSAEPSASRLRGLLEKTAESCYVCDKVEDMFDRYIDTFFMLWSSEKDAQDLVEAVPGYCLPHFARMLDTAERKLNKGKLDAFLAVVIPAQQRFMKQMEEDLEWFTLKFDYRNADEPWKNAKDALPRAMALLHGGSVEGE